MQLREAFVDWQIQANLAAEKAALRDNHIPYILQEEDDLRAELLAFTNTTQFDITMTEPYDYPDPCVGSTWELTDFTV